MGDQLDDPERSLTSGQPGNIEMDRTEIDPNPAPKPQSLRDKLRDHYQKGPPKAKPKVLRGPLAPEIVDKIAVPMYLFTVASGFIIGVFLMCPVMYAHDPSTMFLHQIIISVLCAQMMINWFGIRYVDSTYARYIRLYGTPLKEDLQQHRQEVDGPRQKLAKDSSNSSLKLVPASTDPKIKTHNIDTVSTINHYSLNGKTNSLDTNIKSAGEIIRQDTLKIKEEADMANQAMERRNSVMNSRSIKDLLKSDSSGYTSPQSPSQPPSTFSIEDDTVTSVSESSRLGIPDDLDEISSLAGKNARIGSPLTCPTPTITTNGEVLTKSYPYWSWAPCYDCGRARPPRCHHCPVCNICVLKRDHHCFFAGACVGYRNHRFFCVFLIWAWSGAAYGMFYGPIYIYYFLWEQMSWADLIFPLSAVRWALGYVPLHITLTIAAVSFMIYFVGLAGMFIYAHTRLILWGITSFEKLFLRRSLEIRDTRTLPQKLRSVLGPHWVLNFLVPLHFFTEPVEDPVLWPDIQVTKT